MMNGMYGGYGGYEQYVGSPPACHMGGNYMGVESCGGGGIPYGLSGLITQIFGGDAACKGGSASIGAAAPCFGAGTNFYSAIPAACNCHMMCYKNVCNNMNVMNKSIYALSYEHPTKDNGNFPRNGLSDDPAFVWPSLSDLSGPKSQKLPPNREAVRPGKPTDYDIDSILSALQQEGKILYQMSSSNNSKGCNSSACSKENYKFRPSVPSRSPSGTAYLPPKADCSCRSYMMSGCTSGSICSGSNFYHERTTAHNRSDDSSGASVEAESNNTRDSYRRSSTFGMNHGRGSAPKTRDNSNGEVCHMSLVSKRTSGRAGSSTNATGSVVTRRFTNEDKYRAANRKSSSRAESRRRTKQSMASGTSGFTNSGIYGAGPCESDTSEISGFVDARPYEVKQESIGRAPSGFTNAGIYGATEEFLNKGIIGLCNAKQRGSALTNENAYGQRGRASHSTVQGRSIQLNDSYAQREGSGSISTDRGEGGVVEESIHIQESFNLIPQVHDVRNVSSRTLTNEDKYRAAKRKSSSRAESRRRTKQSMASGTSGFTNSGIYGAGPCESDTSEISGFVDARPYEVKEESIGRALSGFTNAGIYGATEESLNNGINGNYSAKQRGSALTNEDAYGRRGRASRSTVRGRSILFNDPYVQREGSGFISTDRGEGGVVEESIHVQESFNVIPQVHDVRSVSSRRLTNEDKYRAANRKSSSRAESRRRTKQSMASGTSGFTNSGIYGAGPCESDTSENVGFVDARPYEVKEESISRAPSGFTNAGIYGATEESLNNGINGNYSANQRGRASHSTVRARSILFNDPYVQREGSGFISTGRGEGGVVEESINVQESFELIPQVDDVRSVSSRRFTNEDKYRAANRKSSSRAESRRRTKQSMASGTSGFTNSGIYGARPCESDTSENAGFVDARPYEVKEESIGRAPSGFTNAGIYGATEEFLNNGIIGLCNAKQRGSALTNEDAYGQRERASRSTARSRNIQFNDPYVQREDSGFISTDRGEGGVLEESINVQESFNVIPQVHDVRSVSSRRFTNEDKYRAAKRKSSSRAESRRRTKQSIASGTSGFTNSGIYGAGPCESDTSEISGFANARPYEVKEESIGRAPSGFTNAGIYGATEESLNKGIIGLCCAKQRGNALTNEDAYGRRGKASHSTVQGRSILLNDSYAQRKGSISTDGGGGSVVEENIHVQQSFELIPQVRDVRSVSQTYANMYSDSQLLEDHVGPDREDDLVVNGRADNENYCCHGTTTENAGGSVHGSRYDHIRNNGSRSGHENTNDMRFMDSSVVRKMVNSKQDLQHLSMQQLLQHQADEFTDLHNYQEHELRRLHDQPPSSELRQQIEHLLQKEQNEQLQMQAIHMKQQADWNGMNGGVHDDDDDNNAYVPNGYLGGHVGWQDSSVDSNGTIITSSHTEILNRFEAPRQRSMSPGDAEHEHRRSWSIKSSLRPSCSNSPDVGSDYDGRPRGYSTRSISPTRSLSKNSERDRRTSRAGGHSRTTLRDNASLRESRERSRDLSGSSFDYGCRPKRGSIFRDRTLSKTTSSMASIAHETVQPHKKCKCDGELGCPIVSRTNLTHDIDAVNLARKRVADAAAMNAIKKKEEVAVEAAKQRAADALAAEEQRRWDVEAAAQAAALHREAEAAAAAKQRSIDSAAAAEARKNLEAAAAVERKRQEELFAEMEKREQELAQASVRRREAEEIAMVQLRRQEEEADEAARRRQEEIYAAKKRRAVELAELAEKRRAAELAAAEASLKRLQDEANAALHMHEVPDGAAYRATQAGSNRRESAIEEASRKRAADEAVRQTKELRCKCEHEAEQNLQQQECEAEVQILQEEYLAKEKQRQEDSKAEQVYRQITREAKDVQRRLTEHKKREKARHKEEEKLRKQRKEAEKRMRKQMQRTKTCLRNSPRSLPTHTSNEIEDPVQCPGNRHRLHRNQCTKSFGCPIQ